MEIRGALSKLDEFNDDHWTGDGLPKTDVVSDFVGEKVTRQQISNAAPHFTRENLELGDAEEKEEEVPDLKWTDYVSFYRALPSIPKDQLEQTEKEIKKKVDELELRAKKIMEEAADLKRCVGPLRDRIRREFPNGTEQDAIKRYIESQKVMRAERMTMSPIDAAFRARHSPRPRMK